MPCAGQEVVGRNPPPSHASRRAPRPHRTPTDAQRHPPELAARLGGSYRSGAACPWQGRLGAARLPLTTLRVLGGGAHEVVRPDS
eukprot:4169285-Alexandrium_andersonii.AAC.1